MRMPLDGIQWEDSYIFDRAYRCVLGHVERGAAESRHLAWDRARLPFAAGFLRSLRSVEMTNEENESQFVVKFQAYPNELLLQQTTFILRTNCYNVHVMMLVFLIVRRRVLGNKIITDLSS